MAARGGTAEGLVIAAKNTVSVIPVVAALQVGVGVGTAINTGDAENIAEAAVGVGAVFGGTHAAGASKFGFEYEGLPVEHGPLAGQRGAVGTIKYGKLSEMGAQEEPKAITFSDLGEFIGKQKINAGLDSDLGISARIDGLDGQVPTTSIQIPAWDVSTLEKMPIDDPLLALVVELATDDPWTSSELCANLDMICQAKAIDLQRSRRKWRLVSLENVLSDLDSDSVYGLIQLSEF